MKIIKYEKKKNGKYKILLEDNNTIDTYEDVILNNNLLLKKDINENDYNNIINDNKYEEAYLKCVKYISIRLRSKHEIEEYLKKYKYDDNIIDNTINKLFKQNLLDEKRYAYAFTKDKFNFSSAGPYKIKQELQRQKIEDSIIEEAISNLEEDKINEKINKLILKQLKTKKEKDLVLKNKIYQNLLRLGYPTDLILESLSKYIA